MRVRGKRQRARDGARFEPDEPQYQRKFALPGHVGKRGDLSQLGSFAETTVPQVPLDAPTSVTGSADWTNASGTAAEWPATTGSNAEWPAPTPVQELLQHAADANYTGYVTFDPSNYTQQEIGTLVRGLNASLQQSLQKVNDTPLIDSPLGPVIAWLGGVMDESDTLSSRLQSVKSQLPALNVQLAYSYINDTGAEGWDKAP